MEKILTLSILLFLSTFAYAQIPTIYASGGEGVHVDWPKEKREIEQSGGGEFFYNDCDQSVTPVNASSSLPNQGAKNYSVKNVNDFDPMTAWVEGKPGYGIGEFFQIKAEGVNVIYNGYQASPKSWLDNSRVKKFKVYKNNVPLCYLQLKDEMGRQFFDLPDQKKYQPGTLHLYRFEIVEVYPGLKWQDVAISEINFALCCVSSNTVIQNFSSTQKISEIQNGDEIETVDLNTGMHTPARILKSSNQLHLNLLKIRCNVNEIELTYHHPLYIKGIGFCSISKYMNTHGIESVNELIDKVELLIWNIDKKELVFEKIQNIVQIEGQFKTYAIRQLNTGSTYLANGFVTTTY